MKITAVLSGAIFLAFAHTAGAQIIAQHSGSTNPGTEGFKNSEGGYPVFGSPVTSAWNMDQYAWTDDYNQYTFTPAQSAALWTEPWTLTAIMQNLSTGTGFGSGIYADVLANGRFDIDLSSDGAGDQLLSNNGNYATGMVAQPSYTIAGLGTNYATFQMVYNPTSHTADYYVNGTWRYPIVPELRRVRAPTGRGRFVRRRGRKLQTSLVAVGRRGYADAPVFPTEKCLISGPAILGCYKFTGVRPLLWFDPPTASGYTYQMTDGSLFTEIVDLPTGFLKPFDVTAPGCSIPGTFEGGQSVNFVALCGKGVSEFTITGIDPMFDPTDPGAFPIQLAFDTPIADFDAEPLGSTVPEPSTWAMMLLGLAGFGVAAYRRTSSKSAASFAVAWRASD
jgi:hypothetical protein